MILINRKTTKQKVFDKFVDDILSNNAYGFYYDVIGIIPDDLDVLINDLDYVRIYTRTPYHIKGLKEIAKKHNLKFVHHGWYQK